MGLLLLIPGLILQLNDTTWFSGENAVGRVLIIIGAILVALQIGFALVAAGTIRRRIDRF